MNELPPIGQWPESYRKLILAFLVVVTFGYGIGVANLFVTRQTSPQGIAVNLRGLSETELETAEEIVLPRPLRELIITTHNHLLGLATVFGIIGFLFLHTGVFTSRWRIIVAVEPLFSLLGTFGAIWLTRFVDSRFSFLVMMGGIFTHPVFVLQLLVVYRSLIVAAKE